MIGGYESNARLSFDAEIVDDTDVLTAVVSSAAQNHSVSLAYVEANFPVNTAFELHEAPLGLLAEYVSKIVEIEGPIHFDEIVARLRSLWGLARAGSRIRQVIESAVVVAKSRASLDGGPFYLAPGQETVVRDRSIVSSNSLRKPEMLPPAEIELAAMQIVTANFGAGVDDLVPAISRAFGFSATSAQLREIIVRRVDELIAVGRLVQQAGLLVIPRP
ncbi:hypothetical protein M2343_000167 [Sphingobium sp. B8D3B]|nr:hypothetical protein [Sphingobium sp. B8D3B]